MFNIVVYAPGDLPAHNLEIDRAFLDADGLYQLAMECLDQLCIVHRYIKTFLPLPVLLACERIHLVETCFRDQ